MMDAGGVANIGFFFPSQGSEYSPARARKI
jgi:hypothetical protein